MIAEAAMQSGLEATWYPIYDPEVRGGRTTCVTVIADGAVGSPVAGRYSVALLFDQIGVDLHLEEVREDGLPLINSTLAEIPAHAPSRTTGIPASQMAEEMGEPRAANMVMLGALMAATGMLTLEQLGQALERFLARHPEAVAINLQALEAGYQKYEQLVTQGV
jgi:2-oxoglutarate ferredoxin oxidoreductase subunit gamma